MPVKFNKKVLLVLKIVITVACVFWIVDGVDLPGLASSWEGAKLNWVFVALSCQFLALGVGIFRWHTLLNHDAKQKIVLTLTSNAYFVGLAFNQFLPTSVGGDVVRAYLIYRQGSEAKHVISAGIADRLIGMLSMLTMALVAASMWSSFEYTEEILKVLTPLVSGGWLMITLLAFNRSRGLIQAQLGWMGTSRLVTLIRNVILALISFTASPRLILKTVALSAVLQIVIVFAYWFLAKSLQIEIGFLELLLIISITYTAASLPISLGGLGVREGVFVALLLTLGVDKVLATSLSLAYLGVLWASCIPGVLLIITNWSMGLRSKAQEFGAS
jgi:uncharacterized protein (TIRG00374 family)